MGREGKARLGGLRSPLPPAATVCTKRPIPTTACRWACARPHCRSDWARASAWIAWSATAAPSPANRTSAWAIPSSITRRSTRRCPPPTAARRARPSTSATSAAPTRPAPWPSTCSATANRTWIAALNRIDLDLQDDLCEDVPAWWLLEKEKDHVPHRRRRCPLGPFADAVHDESAQLRRRHQASRSRFQGHSRLSAVAEAAEISAADRSLPGRQGRGTVPEPTAPAATAPTATSGPIRTRSCPSTRSAPIAVVSTASPGSSATTTPRAGSTKTIPSARPTGYQAPPLDGIWATAPYFHNGSAPTVYHVLNSKARPKIFTRSYRTDLDAYDAVKLGWKVDVLTEQARSEEAVADRVSQDLRHDAARPRQRRPYLRRQAERRRTHGGD